MDSDDKPFTDFNIADVEEMEILGKLMITNNNILDISSKKMCLYRLFIYHFKAHTIRNKLV